MNALTLSLPTDPCGRMLMYGPGPISDVELLTLLLGPGSDDAAAELLEHGLLGVAKASELDLAQTVSPEGAARLVAAIELSRRMARAPANASRSIQSPRDLEVWLRGLLFGAEQERFFVVALDARQRVIFTREVARGTMSRCEVHPRDVFRPCIRANARSCILVHNHPSGDTTPSDNDVMLTERMILAGEIAGVVVVDSVVISDSGFSSLADLGLMSRSAG